MKKSMPTMTIPTSWQLWQGAESWYEEEKKGCRDRRGFNGPFGFSVGHLPSSRLRVLILLSYLKLFNAHSFQNKICLKFYSNDRKDNDHNDDHGNTQ